MAESFIETFIASRRGSSRDDVFEEFLRIPKISTWAGDDAARVQRLRDEFDRTWRMIGLPEATAPNVPLSRNRETSVAITVEATRLKPPSLNGDEEDAADDAAAGEVAPEQPRMTRVTSSVMCGTCGSLELRAFQRGDVMVIKCLKCDTVYDDLLGLIPVRYVGPFAFLFGEGLRGLGSLVLLATALFGAYALLRWLL